MHKPILADGLCECGCGQKVTLRKRFAFGHTSLNGPVAFWARIDSVSLDPAACWEWPGPRLERGYGVFGKLKVHRVMFEHTGGTIPAGLNVLHKCDNPPCCNPAHLFLGTHAENMRDMVSKGRSHNGHRRRTPDEIRAMHERYREGTTQRQIAHEFGLADEGTVSKIFRRARQRGVIPE